MGYMEMGNERKRKKNENEWLDIRAKNTTSFKQKDWFVFEI